MTTVLHRLPDEEIAFSAMESMGPLATSRPVTRLRRRRVGEALRPWEDEATEAEADGWIPRHCSSPRENQEVSRSYD